MLIANPIYDVVFKYLLEDSRIAKMLISAIIGEDIVEIDFRPQEYTVKITKNSEEAIEQTKEFVPSFTVYRLDFNAKIQNSDGSFKLVIIEIQKAKLSTDITRFRKYLGEQYSNQENSYEKNGKKLPLPIINIYFLGEGLKTIHGVPVIKVNRHYYDLVSGTEITQREEFIEALSHDSYVVSIPDLTEKRRNELEILLSIFDQSNRYKNDHILNVAEEDFPEKYRYIIRRLQKAQETEQIRKTMDIEDEILSELADKERDIMAKDRIIAENMKVIDEKNKTLEEKDKALAEQQRIIAELTAKLK